MRGATSHRTAISSSLTEILSSNGTVHMRVHTHIGRSRTRWSNLRKKNIPDVEGHHNHHHHHISVMELGHLLTRSGLTYPEVSSKAYHDSFCQLASSISLPWVIYFEAFYLHVVSSFSCIPVICPKLMLFLTPLQFVHLLCNLSYFLLISLSR